MKKLWLSCILLFFVLIISACGNQAQETNSGESSQMEMHSGSHEEMETHMHSDSGELPEGLKSAENPKYEVGSKVIMEAGHMDGMQGAEAVISGAYDTTAYTVSYTPSNGGERVTDHKWVIHEEIKDAGEEALEPGTEVTLEAEHMEGMDGVTAEIDSAEETTVYMVDFVPSSGGEEVKNHKWVTESELSVE